MSGDPFRDETADPVEADRRNFYKVEEWTADGLHIEAMPYAGNSLDRARAVFDAAAKRRPAIVITIRQRIRVIAQWPQK